MFWLSLMLFDLLNFDLQSKSRSSWILIDWRSKSAKGSGGGFGVIFIVNRHPVKLQPEKCGGGAAENLGWFLASTGCSDFSSTCDAIASACSVCSFGAVSMFENWTFCLSDTRSYFRSPLFLIELLFLAHHL